MKLLVVVPTYPHAGHPFSGVFNERAVQGLSKLCDAVEVLVPRPYVPPFFSLLLPRWKAYAAASGHEIRNSIPVHRPSVPVIPRIGDALWLDQAAFFWSRRTAHKMHERRSFDAIVSFDLLGAGTVAWRLGRDLGITASGWATGGDLRVAKSSSYARAVVRSLTNLDMIFYQSHELLERATGLLGAPEGHLSPERHMVLPRGIPEPPILSRQEIRQQMRQKLGVKKDEVLVLGLGRVAKDKGVFELLHAVSVAANRQPRICCVLVGSLPAFDETAAVQKKLDATPHLREKLKILPTCAPETVWEYLCAADIFAFASHHEGMPNSLLEAMVMGIPAVAFAIPPVKELEGGSGGIVMIPPFDSTLFADAMVRLALDPGVRRRIGEKAKCRVREGFMIEKNMKVALDRVRHVKRKLEADKSTVAMEPSSLIR